MKERLAPFLKENKETIIDMGGMGLSLGTIVFAGIVLGEGVYIHTLVPAIGVLRFAQRLNSKVESSMRY